MSCGVLDNAELLKLMENGCSRFCIDVAHGHSEQVAETIKFIKEQCPTASVIAGNVCTYEGYTFLARAGADIIKVGVGGGSICCTRMKTAFGVPQFSAVSDCGKAKEDLKKEHINTWLIADGGIKNPRDAVLCFAVGADIVMMGSLFAKSIESAGKKFIRGTHGNYVAIDGDNLPTDEEIFSHYRGQASSNFMQSYYGDAKKNVVAEGVDCYTKCIGTTASIVNEYSGSLRSALTYNGSKTIAEFQNNVDMFQSTTSYMVESNTRTHQ